MTEIETLKIKWEKDVTKGARQKNSLNYKVLIIRNGQKHLYNFNLFLSSHVGFVKVTLVVN